MKCFSYDSFSFFQEQVLLIFYLPFWFHVKYSRMLKNSELYIRDHLSGTKVTIWIDSEYDAVFDFSCVASWPFIRYQGNNLDWFWIWCCFRFFYMKNWKNYESYVVWNLISGCQTQEKYWVEYQLKKEPRRLISKITSYHNKDNWNSLDGRRGYFHILVQQCLWWF